MVDLADLYKRSDAGREEPLLSYGTLYRPFVFEGVTNLAEYAIDWEDKAPGGVRTPKQEYMRIWKLGDGSIELMPGRRHWNRTMICEIRMNPQA